MIHDRNVKRLYQSFLDAIQSFHNEVGLETTRVEIRAYYGNALLCRVVPYRELFHVQVGEENAWEIRVRDEAGYLDTLDRVLVRFLNVFALRETSPASFE